MNTLASIALALTTFVATQTAMAATKVGVPAPPASRASQSDAPFHGEIVRVDATAGVIVIGRQTFTVSAPMLAVLVKRPRPTGLLDLATLEPGMQVRYRTVMDGQTTRVVELWVMHDAPKAE
jgi:hypothetical protein